MTTRTRLSKRPLTLLAGVTSLLLAAAIGAPTSAAYTATAAIAGMEKGAPVEWKMPQAGISGKRILDAAYHKASGHTYMIVENADKKTIYVSAIPGAKPTPVQLPSVSSLDPRKLVVDGDTLYLASDDGLSIWIDRFEISADGTLRAMPKRHSLYWSILSGWQMTDFAVAADTFVVVLVNLQKNQTSIHYGDSQTPGVYPWNLPSCELGAAGAATDVSVSPTGNKIWISTAVPGAGTCTGDLFTALVGTSVEAESATRAWFGRVGGMALVSYPSSSPWSPEQGWASTVPVVPALDRSTGVVLAASPLEASSSETFFHKIRPGAVATEYKFSLGRAKFTSVLSGYGAVLVLLADGSIGWLL